MPDEVTTTKIVRKAKLIYREEIKGLKHHFRARKTGERRQWESEGEGARAYCLDCFRVLSCFV
jgi:hypothetical protein